MGQRGNRRRSPSARSLRASGLLGAGMALAGGLLVSCTTAENSSDSPAPAPAIEQVDNRQTAAPVGRGKLAPEVAAVPVKVTIPAGSARIKPSGTISNGELQLPETTKVIAWWAAGAAPGETGVTLLAGHVNTRTEKSGLFTRLDRLRPGDKVSVTTYDGTQHRYVVSEAPQNYEKNSLPNKRLFRSTGKHELALITCSGKWDPRLRAYPNNLIVWASPA